MIKFVLSLFTFLFVAQCTNAQLGSYTVYNYDHGLRGSLFECEEDDAGNLWFASSMGVEKFDGKKFQEYGMSDSLASTQSYQLSKSENGNSMQNINDKNQTLIAIPFRMNLINSHVHSFIKKKTKFLILQ